MKNRVEAPFVMRNPRTNPTKQPKQSISARNKTGKDKKEGLECVHVGKVKQEAREVK